MEGRNEWRQDRAGGGECRTEAGVERISEETSTFELGPGSNSQGQVHTKRGREGERVMEMREREREREGEWRQEAEGERRKERTKVRSCLVKQAAGKEGSRQTRQSR